MDRIGANNFVSLVSYSLCVGLGHYSKALSHEIFFFLIFSCFNETDKVRAASPVVTWYTHSFSKLSANTDSPLKLGLDLHAEAEQVEMEAAHVLEHTCSSERPDLKGKALFTARISLVLDSELTTALFLESRWSGNPPRAVGQGNVCIIYGLLCLNSPAVDH